MSLISLASVRALQEDAVAEGKARPGRIPGAADAQERIVGHNRSVHALDRHRRLHTALGLLSRS